MSNYFYKDKPIFGLDIGFSSMKVMQIDYEKKDPAVKGYGVIRFDNKAVKDGIIIDPESLAKAAYELFDQHIIGEINTRRVAMAIPAARTFSRAITLPKLASKDIDEAVRLEAEQYIPVPLDQLYFDYSIVKKTDKEMEVYAVAVPKKLINSYLQLARLLDLEVIMMETTIGAAARLFVQAEQSTLPTMLVDLGSISTDLTIYDKTLIVTGTVPGGGDSFTNLIGSNLGVSHEEAHIIKTKYGLGVSKKQQQITSALTPMIESMAKEVQRMIRYYEERNTDKKINQAVTMGGGANMPGLSEYLTNQLRLPVRMCDPWLHLGFKKLQPPNISEKSMYVTVAGLALMSPKEIF